MDTTITLVEATDVASAASGKSGGFLASDWHGQATASRWGGGGRWRKRDL